MFLIGDMDDRVIADFMNYVLISQSEVCQEGGYSEDLEGS